VRLTDGRCRVGVGGNKLKDLQIEKTRTAYCKVGADLVTFCLQVTGGDITGFEPMTFTPEMTAAGEKLEATLWKTSTRDQDEALQAYLLSLFTHKRCGSADKFVFPAYNFLIIYSFTEHGNLRPCGMFSQYFSKVVFFARAAIFKAITAQAKDKKMGFHE